MLELPLRRLLLHSRIGLLKPLARRLLLRNSAGMLELLHYSADMLEKFNRRFVLLSKS